MVLETLKWINKRATLMDVNNLLKRIQKNQYKINDDIKKVMQLLSYGE